MKQSITLTEKVQSIINSNISTYEFAKKTGLPKSLLSKLRRGESHISNITLGKAEVIGSLYDEIERESQTR